MNLPSTISKSVIALNPHLYGPAKIPAVLFIDPPRLTEKPRKSVEERLNKTERRWLAVLRERGHHDAAPWRIRLVLANGVTYVPDFYVPHTLGKPTFFETKGAFQREKGEIKLRMAASQFPEFRFIKATWADGRWTEAEVKP